jgi:four helix bundle suffix protein
LLCLAHQASYLLNRQMRRLESDFVEKGGFTERLYRFRKDHRSGGNGSVRESGSDWSDWSDLSDQSEF